MAIKSGRVMNDIGWWYDRSILYYSTCNIFEQFCEYHQMCSCSFALKKLSLTPPPPKAAGAGAKLKRRPFPANPIIRVPAKTAIFAGIHLFIKSTTCHPQGLSIIFHVETPTHNPHNHADMLLIPKNRLRSFCFPLISDSFCLDDKAKNTPIP